MYVVLCIIQVDLKKFKNAFLSIISESETHKLYRSVTHRVKSFKPLFLNFFYERHTDEETLEN